MEFRALTGVRIINKKGFTLIELIITIAITSVLFLIIGSYFATNIGLFNREELQIEVLNNAQVGMDNVLYHLYSVKGIYNESSTNPKMTGGEFESVDLEDSGGIVYTILYDKEKQQVELRNGTDTKVLAENVSAFQMEPLSSEMPTVSPAPTTNPLASSYKNCIGFRVTLTSSIRNLRETLKNDVYFRNKE